MGQCTYCGNDAGFLRTEHKECKLAYEKGKEQIHQIIADKLTKEPAISLKNTIKEIATSSNIHESEMTEAVIVGWENAVSKALEDDILSKEEEESLVNLRDAYGLTKEQIDRNGAFQKLIKAVVIRDLLEGSIPYRLTVEGNVPFNLQKGERIVWLFQQVKYFEERIITQYQGSYSGISVRIAKGLYYRTGGFRGNPVATTNVTQIDEGVLAITEKHIYFSGSRKAFRIPYSKIVSFRPYADGLGIQRDAQTAKPQIFVVDDGWFIHNLVTNIANIGKT